ncbi:hypothetical protein M378DRAFT_167088, partial [Amanita muscaria Koide BX008]
MSSIISSASRILGQVITVVEDHDIWFLLTSKLYKVIKVVCNAGYTFLQVDRTRKKRERSN